MRKESKHANQYKQGVIRITSKPIGFFTNSSNDKSANDADVVIYEENLNCALDKDLVEIEIIGKDFYRGEKRQKGKVVKILERNKTEFVGTLENSSNGGKGLYFLPDDWKFYRKIELKNFSNDAKPGDKALVKLINWNNPNINPTGEIIKVIGKKGVHETEMQSILLDKGIVYDFPADVEEEAERVAEEFRKETVNPEKSNQRRDFRNITTFTIDPKDAKDFDDALSYEDLGGGKIRVGVHIADVSHFVRPGSALDRESRKRSFSTYLVDRTIPMLPEVLSNDLCSLNPNVDRFAFAAVFDIESSTGKVLDRWFGKTVINSDKRFSYEEAQELLDEFKRSGQTYSSSLSHEGLGSRNSSFPTSLAPIVSELNRLANIYRAENKKNGAIEFETDEVKFELDEEGKPIRVYKKPRLDTMKMIEEWMLLANREVARFISEKTKTRGGAGIFRIHNLPKMEKLEALAIFVRALGHELPIKNGEVSAKDINALLIAIEGHASESLIKTAAIRSMAKAVYSTKNIGHFGLAFEYYTHFTSPIRRYPDLLVHRILENHINSGKISKDELVKFEKIATECSDKEITVQEAERESIRYKQVEFMQNKVGQEFDAVISGVTEWGMYVEDPETKVEGMVRLKDIEGDNFVLDEKNYAIVGERTKTKYSLGDKIRVKLISANLDRKTLDFKLV